MTRRRWFGWLLIVVGLAGFGYSTLRFATIPELVVRPGSLEVRSDQACAIEPAGTVVCWGEQVDSEIESAREYSFWRREGVVRVAGIDDATSLASLDFSTCALRETSEVTCWGRFRGLFADQSPEVSEVQDWWGGFYSQKAIPIVELTGVVEIAASRRDFCALHDTAVITCISLDHGRLTIEPSDGFTPVGDLIAGDGSVCAIDLERQVICVPLANIDERETLAVDADWLSSEDSPISGDLACAGAEGGVPTCWASTTDSGRVVQEIPSMAGAEGMFLQFATFCGVDAGGVRCIENTSITRSVDFDLASLPSIELPSLDDVVVAGSSGFRSCASLTDGRVQCWGNAGRYATLGDAGNTRSSIEPVFVGAWGLSQQIRWVWQGAFLLPLLVGVWLVTSRRQPPPPAADAEPIPSV